MAQHVQEMQPAMRSKWRTVLHQLFQEAPAQADRAERGGA